VPRAKRRLGQHFLADPRILARIADAVQANPGDTILEIGPGPGGLTNALLERAGRVIAIEKDEEMVEPLRNRYPSLELVHGDALALDWHALVQGPFRVAGNIPYNITSPLLDKALTPPPPARIVFLVQKEVAERVTAEAGTAEYGALTVGVQTMADAERLFTVPAGAFYPRPKIDSAVLRLTPRHQPMVSPSDRDTFRTMVVGLFGFRRKQIGRGLRELTGWDSGRVHSLLEEAAIVDSARPEVLTPKDFVRLHRALVDGGWAGR
jgi:16S rRNA (adenine1518-N6/adenine1519-N6)-dimethyltransferase